MRYRKIDAHGDAVFGGQQADFHRDNAAAVAQAVATRLRLLRGEWFLDSAEGTPWSTDVLGKNTRATYDGAVRQRILGTPGVVELTGYSSFLDTETRELRMTATLATVYGSSTVEAIL